MVFLQGGPSHIDIWDPKPDAPANIRGDFKPIKTAVPGLSDTMLTQRLRELETEGVLERRVVPTSPVRRPTRRPTPPPGSGRSTTTSCSR